MPEVGVKSKTITLILWFFNLHRFYLGKIGTGILYFITLGGFFIWIIIDLIAILNDRMTDSHGHLLKK